MCCCENRQNLRRAGLGRNGLSDRCQALPTETPVPPGAHAKTGGTGLVRIPDRQVDTIQHAPGTGNRHDRGNDTRGRAKMKRTVAVTLVVELDDDIWGLSDTLAHHDDLVDLLREDPEAVLASVREVNVCPVGQDALSQNRELRETIRKMHSEKAGLRGEIVRLKKKLGG